MMKDCPSEFISRESVICGDDTFMSPIFCTPTNTCATATGHVWWMLNDSVACGSEKPTCAIVLPGAKGPVIVNMSPLALACGEEPCIIDAPAAPRGRRI